MHRYHRRRLPERMIALAIQPPPLASDPPAPFGFGAFIVTPRVRGEAGFERHAQGYAAGYPPRALRERLQGLFTPDTLALIYHRAPGFEDQQATTRVPLQARMMDHIPRSGLRTSLLVALPHHVFRHAGAMAGVQLPGRHSTPLGRLGYLGAEAQTAWIYWLFRHCAPSLRRHLLASYEAWQAIEKAKRKATA